MANSFVQYTGDGNTTAFSITFDFIDASHLTCTVNGVNTSYTLSSGNTVATLSSPPAVGAAIEFRRSSSQSTRLTDYVAGSVLKESDLDTDSKQGFFLGQEAIDDAQNTIQQDPADFNWTANNKKIKNVTDPTAAQHVATKNYVDTAAASQVAQATSQASAAATSASNASTSETNAANSASAAAASATAAAASETASASSETTSGTNATNASNSASAAAASQSAAATSATNAANSESAVATNATNAANSATAAAASASAASTSESNSSTSETNSAASQTAAANSATAAANSASAASTSETNAASSATAAATSATNAGTSETNAATSASTATTQATNAATSATAAQAAQTAAELAADNFDDTYLGAKASNPSVDNDGAALTAGDLYFNTTDNKLKVYDGSNWNDTVVSITNLVEKSSNTGSAYLPSGTTAQRDGSPAAGYIRFNSTDTSFEGYDGSAWGTIGGGGAATGGNNDQVFIETDQTVTTSYTLTSNKNAMSISPLTIASGVQIIVPTGQRWLVL